MKKIYSLFALILFTIPAFSQIRQQPAQQMPSYKIDGLDLDYFSPREFIIGGTTIQGTQYLDKGVLVKLSKLTEGERITLPGEATSNAIKNLWSQGLFDDIKLSITKINYDTVYFEFDVVELPRLIAFEFSGVSKSQNTELQEKLSNKAGKTILNTEIYNYTTNIVTKYLQEKGYFFTKVSFSTTPDPNQENGVFLQVKVDRGNKVKVNQINFTGNKVFSDAKLKKFLKKTKQRAFYKVFGPGKFNREKFEADKITLIEKIHAKGYRDAQVLRDSVYGINDKTIGIDIDIYEGPKYYFGDITWAGNAKYTTEFLSRVLGIEKGEVFSEEKLQKRLNGSTNGDDVSSIYLDDGYLTFNIDPVQTSVIGDTINIEMRISEGPQYTNNRIKLVGNTITNERVVMREIRTKPGEKFSKRDLVATVRDLGQMGNFDETKINPRPIPNAADGTVDIEYTVEEKPSDQIELSGGFGGGRIIGTLGLTFNNFSLKNLFNGSAYKPLPKGDGQKLSLRGQTNGKFYQSYSFSFSEPWLGGNKPINFGLSAYTSLQSNGLRSSSADYFKIRMNGVTVTMGTRLKWPDDLFRLSYSINASQYVLNNYPGFLFSSGTSYNFNLTQEISRDSRNNPIFPTDGSYFKFLVQATPPYSLLNNVNYLTATDKQKYKFTEYHKWKFDSQWFQRVAGKLVFKAQAQFGFLGLYNRAVGQSAFERFKLGGDGMQGFDFLQGSELIAMRGYANNSIIPFGANQTIAQNSGSPIFAKYVLEFRYPVLSSQQATAFLVTFAEGGNTWNKFSDFNPLNIRRSIGVGAKVFLPIFGLLGVDYGYGFDKIPGNPNANGGQFHFSIAQQLGGL
ncbi:outer membrane protein assembly factor BamA [Pedobacter flavus]|uniref:Outer membrane protein assembly factor BamA n=1 Tax=Pedobacter flavus TaxID=3113906 RepID=A0ABU7H1J4_9SPHI|nr:outer membrane protein assembly factor BamA [Pedobacter sp. VNH31]MEE1885191.1 outer membrane protein assembly factor BamA [Pedobacter sp. VNH31]